MTEKGWLGPNAPTARHADAVTIDHIIDLRKQITKLEVQIERIMSWITPMQKNNNQIKEALYQCIWAINQGKHKSDLLDAMEYAKSILKNEMKED